MKSPTSSRTLVTVLLFVAFCLASSVVQAQPRRGGMPDSTQIAAMVDTLAKKISLSAEQTTKVRALYFSSNADLRKQIEKNRGDWTAMREIRAKNMESRDTQIKELLNDEQKAAYDKYVKAQREEMERRMRERRGIN